MSISLDITEPTVLSPVDRSREDAEANDGAAPGPPSRPSRLREAGRAATHLGEGRARGRVEFRNGAGWTWHVPAPIAAIGLGSLALAGLLSVFEPVAIRAAVVDRQAADLERWERAERVRRHRAVEAMETPLRELRREALRRGIPPSGDLAPGACLPDPAAHFEGHAREAARLSAALASRGVASDGMLPSRAPIDLRGGDFPLTLATGLPDAIYVSSGKGTRSDPFTGRTKRHLGLDISAPEGTPVVATADGEIVFAGTVDPNDDHARSLLGSYVEILHGTTGFRTLYAHLSAVDVKAGEKVRAGSRIGAVGTTGRSTAPHLHYQVTDGPIAVDPLLYITDVVLVRDGESIRYRVPRTP